MQDLKSAPEETLRRGLFHNVLNRWWLAAITFWVLLALASYAHAGVQYATTQDWGSGFNGQIGRRIANCCHILRERPSSIIPKSVIADQNGSCGRQSQSCPEDAFGMLAQSSLPVLSQIGGPPRKRGEWMVVVLCFWQQSRASEP